jgi:hypothetical protein
MSGSRITIRFGRWKPLLIAVGLAPSRAYLQLDADVVRVRMGWCFHADVPRRSIRSVRRVGNELSIGVHGWAGRWLVNGAAGPLVALAFEPPDRAHVLGFPVRLRELVVSVDDPDAVVAELRPR